MALEITPLRLSRFDKAHWKSERPMYLSYLRQLEPLTRDMLQEAGPQDTYLLARLVQSLQEAGASVGLADVVRGTGYAVGGGCPPWPPPAKCRRPGSLPCPERYSTMPRNSLGAKPQPP